MIDEWVNMMDMDEWVNESRVPTSYQRSTLLAYWQRYQCHMIYFPLHFWYCISLLLIMMLLLLVSPTTNEDKCFIICHPLTLIYFVQLAANYSTPSRLLFYPEWYILALSFLCMVC